MRGGLSESEDLSGNEGEWVGRVADEWVGRVADALELSAVS
jgi:hypothetical protein